MIYFDNNATTPLDATVLDKMMPYLREQYGNPASRSHAMGWVADEAVTIAREQIASAINAESKEIIFTSGATESVNLAIKGVFEAYNSKGQHVITVKTEHKAVLDTCDWVSRRGGEVTLLDVDKEGRVDIEALEEAIRPDTILVSIMWANNETGCIQDMAAIGQICRSAGVLLFSDATQALTKTPIDVQSSRIDILAFSGHKVYGPKGIGGLYVRSKSPRVRLMPLIDGGGHERGMRSGTLNVPGIVGLGAAVELGVSLIHKESSRLEALRDRLEFRLLHEIEDCVLNTTAHRMPHVINIRFLHVDGEALMLTFNQKLAVASGSACTSASIEPSHVLMASGLTEDEAHSSIRISLGRYTSEKEIEEAFHFIQQGVQKLRSESPIWKMYKSGQLT